MLTAGGGGGSGRLLCTRQPSPCARTRPASLSSLQAAAHRQQLLLALKPHHLQHCSAQAPTHQDEPLARARGRRQQSHCDPAEADQQVSWCSHGSMVAPCRAAVTGQHALLRHRSTAVVPALRTVVNCCDWPAGRRSFVTACHAARSQCPAGKHTVRLRATVVGWSRPAAVWHYHARLQTHRCNSTGSRCCLHTSNPLSPSHPSLLTAASCTSAMAWPSPLCASWARGCPLRRATALSSARSTPVRWRAGWVCCNPGAPADSLACGLGWTVRRQRVCGMVCRVGQLHGTACCLAHSLPRTAVCRGLAEAAWSHVGCLPHVPVLLPLLSPFRREGWAAHLDMERPALHDRHCRGPGPHAGLHRNWWVAAAAVLYTQKDKPLVALQSPG